MNRISNCIIITSVAVLVYIIAVSLQAAFAIAFFLLLVSQGLLIWMVIRILKDDYTTTKTFDTHFYQDID